MTGSANRSPITTIAFLNNAISAQLTRRDLSERNIPLSEVAVILGRDVEEPWLAQCARVVAYGGRPESTLLGQRRFVAFFREAASLLRQLFASGALRRAYIVNNDNILSAHILEMARRQPLEVSVVAEGLMNYQDITVKNRAGWRWRVKPVVSAALGLRYRRPAGHLSGAYDPVVDRIVTFTLGGMKGPAEKMCVLPLPAATPRVVAEPDVGLIVHTGLWAWMSPESYRPLAEAFADYVRAAGFRKLYAKPHPRVETGILDQLLPPHEIIDTRLSLEEIAGDLEAGTVLGTCCTGLVTLKLMRPELHCIDFGGEYYCRHAYGGDYSVLEMMRGAGIDLQLWVPTP